MDTGPDLESDCNAVVCPVWVRYAICHAVLLIGPVISACIFPDFA